MLVHCVLCFEVDADPYDTVGEAYNSSTNLSEGQRKPYIEIEEEKKWNRKGMNESITWKGVFYVIHKRYIVAENIGLFAFLSVKRRYNREYKQKSSNARGR